MRMCHYYKIPLNKQQPEKSYYITPGYLTLFALDKFLSLFCHHPYTHTSFISITTPQSFPSQPLYLLQSWCLQSDCLISNFLSPLPSPMALASHLISLYFSICIVKVGIMMVLLHRLVMKIESNAYEVL